MLTKCVGPDRADWLLGLSPQHGSQWRPRGSCSNGNPPTNPGVVSFCFEFSNFFFPLKELFPAYVEFFSKCCKLLENRREREKRGSDALGQTPVKPRCLQSRGDLYDTPDEGAEPPAGGHTGHLDPECPPRSSPEPRLSASHLLKF